VRHAVHSPASHAPHVPVDACVHPVAGAHASVVQVRWSSQSRGPPLAQEPPAQVSPAVQALPSSHGAALSVKTHDPALQMSVVQTLPSLHGIGCPSHVPAAQASLTVHALPSLQALPFDFAGLVQVPVPG
jgi:hypothetical protein